MAKIDYKPLELAGARALAEARAVTSVHIVGCEHGLAVFFNNTFIISNRHKRPRYFAKADTCLLWLKELGLNKVSKIDLSKWKVGSSSGELPKGKNVTTAKKSN